jgi:hypothetical protein
MTYAPGSDTDYHISPVSAALCDGRRKTPSSQGAFPSCHKVAIEPPHIHYYFYLIIFCLRLGEENVIFSMKSARSAGYLHSMELLWVVTWLGVKFRHARAMCRLYHPFPRSNENKATDCIVRHAIRHEA